MSAHNKTGEIIGCYLVTGISGAVGGIAVAQEGLSQPEKPAYTIVGVALAVGTLLMSSIGIACAPNGSSSPETAVSTVE